MTIKTDTFCGFIFINRREKKKSSLEILQRDLVAGTLQYVLHDAFKVGCRFVPLGCVGKSMFEVQAREHIR